jgi:hypothetical protein
MRQALLTRTPQRTRTVKTVPMPSPVGGWNARDALAAMPPTDAVILDNLMPKASYVELRGGYSEHIPTGSIGILTEGGLDLATESNDLLITEATITSITGTIKTLSIYNPLNSANQMFAISEFGVWNVSTAGTAGPLLIARTNGKHQGTMFGDGTTNWRIEVNGVDDPLYYNGTTWQTVDETTSPALTGYTGNAVQEFVYVNAYKARLFFIPRNSLSFWYLPPAVAGGALLEFDLSSQCKMGGYLVAMASWTRDAGDGQDDVAVFVTSEGEAIVYQGDNPSQANSWSKIGAFFVGRPLGRRCLMQLAGDILILTENGAFPISAAMQSASVNYQYAISSKIEPVFTESGRTSGRIFGWEAILYPAQQALLVNVPVTEDGIHYQYVMNTSTKSWCRFVGWDAETFVIFNRELYFSRGNAVYKAWNGAVDGSDTISYYGKQAFSNFGQPNNLKVFKFFRPIMQVNGTLNYATAIDIDFDESPLIGLTSTGNVNGMTWNVSLWNEAKWGGSVTGGIIVKPWGSVAQWPGHWGAGKIKGSTNSLSVRWMSSQYCYETGGLI